MRVIIELLRPRPLTVILFLLALVMQFVLFSSVATTIVPMSDVNPESAYRIGLGVPITVSTMGDETSVSIRWMVLALNLVGSYFLAAVAAVGLIKAVQLRRPATAYCLVAVVAVIVAFLVSIVLSKFEWGYFFARPDVLSEVGEIARVNAVVPVITQTNESGKRVFVADADYSFSERIASGKADSYYCLDARILIELERRNLLPEAPATHLDELPDVYSLVQASGMLETSEPGYDSASGLRGVVVDAVDSSGDRLLFLGLKGGQVSNDHYPYYEVLFRQPKGVSGLSFARGQRFFYDLAGMEGFEWDVVWLVLTVPAIVGAFVIFTIGRFVWRKVRRENS